MIAYPEAQTTTYSKSIVELMIKTTKEIGSWRAAGTGRIDRA
jgi:hypothetical protein